MLARTICGVGLAAYTDRSRDAASSGTTMLPPQRPPAAEGVAKKRLLRGRTPIVVGEARWGLGDLFPLPQQVPTRSALGARVCDTKDKEDVEEAAAADVVVAAEVRWKNAEANHIRPSRSLAGDSSPSPFSLSQQQCSVLPRVLEASRFRCASPLCSLQMVENACRTKCAWRLQFDLFD